MLLLAQAYPIMHALTTTSENPSNHALNDETQISHRDGETPGFLSCAERKCIMSTLQEDNGVYQEKICPTDTWMLEVHLTKLRSEV